MNYADAKIENARLLAVSDAADFALKSIPGVGSGVMGLTPDNVKFTEEYRIARHRASIAFDAWRNHNGFMVKNFKKEMAADRKAKYAAMSANDK